MNRSKILKRELLERILFLHTKANAKANVTNFHIIYKVKMTRLEIQKNMAIPRDWIFSKSLESCILSGFLFIFTRFKSKL